jgi:hypothetical protein
MPIGADVDKVLKMGSQNLSAQIGSYDLLKRQDGDPQWIIHVSVTFLFSENH